MNEKFSYEEQDGVLVGPMREPLNSARHYGEGSIHDDSTAQKLGFRGGTVAGSLHMEQWPPLLAAAFGEEWFKTGGLSLYFKYATTDGEPVQAYVDRPAPGARQIRTWMKHGNGNLVAEGTASIGGPDPDSALRQRIAEVRAPEDLRIFSALSVGDVSARVTASVPAKALDARVEIVTEPLDGYTDASVYGERIMTPALHVHLLSHGGRELMKGGVEGVGLYGAIELQYHRGPVFVDHDYEVQGEVLALSESPKTENVFYESTIFEPGSNEPVMSMIMMLRYMKQSSKLWA